MGARWKLYSADLALYKSILKLLTYFDEPCVLFVCVCVCVVFYNIEICQNMRVRFW